MTHKKTILHKSAKKILADTYTPVNLYLKIRDVFPQTALLESADFQSATEASSFICFNPLVQIQISANNLIIEKGGKKHTETFSDSKKLIAAFEEILASVECKADGFTNGYFGYFSFESLAYFDTVKIAEGYKSQSIPQARFTLYQNIIQINHYKNEANIYCFSEDGSSNLKAVEDIIYMSVFPQFKFKTDGERESNLSDAEYKEMVKHGIEHCKKGDVFQIVLSRAFKQKFTGDDFNAYRALRSINPSPYLFYFDYGDFKIFGSSPESQLVVSADGKVEIDPIAGTVKRSGDDKADRERAKALSEDEKENAEHTMLVDLARNDLSKIAHDVKVSSHKKVHFYSHVIHLVSKVIGRIKPNVSAVYAFGSTFPAGTLSGAPKYRAIELIGQYENQYRGEYGGSIGFLGLDGSANLAITIRSFLSKNSILKYQAGAGVVSKSTPESELQEVFNKVAALEAALKLAEEI